MKVTFRIPTFPIGLMAMAFAFGAMAQNALPGLVQRPAAITRPADGQSLTPASTASGLDIARNYLKSRGASAATLTSLRVAAENRTARNGLTHLRLEQQVGGLTVHGAYAKAALNARGELVHWIDHLVPAAGDARPTPATIDEAAALKAAFARVHPNQSATFQAGSRTGNSMAFAGGPFFHANPTVTRVAVPLDNGTLAVGFLVETWSQKANQLHHTLVAGDGRILGVESRTANDSYRVFVEDPAKTPQSVVAGPGSGNAESPAGWLGTGAQTTWNIKGNNANAYLDADKNNRADKGGTAVTDGNFLTMADLGQTPTSTANKAVAVQNLFYLNNVVHDVLYRYGFTEEAGNFQLNNFGLGGSGNDPVNAEAQDGGGTDNANFATPSDGRPPRMQMYLWTGAGPTHQVIVNGFAYGAMGAQFGPKLTTTGITGTLVDVDGEACTAIGQSLQGRVAIVDRGTCNFTVKVLNAQQAGAVAVIVVNNVPGNDSFTMGGTERRVKIPSVMVGNSDGQSIRTQAGLTTGTVRLNPTQPLQIDGDLDSDIVFHEYGHGLTWRMVGGMSGPLAGALGEGCSDVLAFLLNGDDAVGEYAFSNPLGIRREPYAVYTRTYASVTGAEVHDDGEIYAAAMWRVLENFRNAGVPSPQETLLGYFVDGFNFTPSTPTFENMRDGFLTAITDSQHKCLAWQGFAALGLGQGSSATVSGSTVTTTPSFIVPAGVCPP